MQFRHTQCGEIQFRRANYRIKSFNQNGASPIAKIPAIKIIAR